LISLDAGKLTCHTVVHHHRGFMATVNFYRAELLQWGEKRPRQSDLKQGLKKGTKLNQLGRLEDGGCVENCQD
jgi:TfoX/Sxy family transcriptional regulator of competence genes